MPEPEAHQKEEITRLSSSLVYRNPWLSLREDTIRRADGSKGIYGVIEKADFVVIAAVHSGQLTLVEQYRYPVGARHWEFPQGSWEHRSTDPLSLAHAELQEETGLQAGSMIHAGHLLLACGYSTQGYDVYLAKDLQQQDRKLDHEEQGLIARSFAISDVEEMIRDGVIRDASTVAAFGLLRLKGLL